MTKLTTKAIDNSELIKSKYAQAEEVIVKQINVTNKTCVVMYSRGLVDVIAVADYIVRPLKEMSTFPKTEILQKIKDVIVFPDATEESDVNKIVEEINHGKAVLIIDGVTEVLCYSVDKMKERSIAEPPTSAVLKGPREGFVENYKTNLGLLKKIVATKDLKTESVKVGTYTSTTISIVYIDKVCDKKLVQQVKHKLNQIKLDGVIDSYYISSYLEERPHSIFKQVGSNEKPDIVAAKLLEGRLALVVDGSPIVLTLPYILFEDVQNSDDYYSQYARASLIRWLRLFCSLITVMLPALYLAVQLYHYKVLPLSFLITITNTAQNIPFTPFMEILFVLILFEILYEASLRMPQYLGIALSVVGALILGDTAVQAGLISSPAVMIVALSGITLYTIPDQAPQLSLLRFGYTLIGGMLGFYGIIVFSLFLIIYLSDMDNYGAPYLAPYAPYVRQDVNDGIFKQDLVDMKTRPKSISKNNKGKRRVK